MADDFQQKFAGLNLAAQDKSDLAEERVREFWERCYVAMLHTGTSGCLGDAASRAEGEWRKRFAPPSPEMCPQCKGGSWTKRPIHNPDHALLGEAVDIIERLLNWTPPSLALSIRDTILRDDAFRFRTDNQQAREDWKAKQ